MDVLLLFLSFLLLSSGAASSSNAVVDSDGDDLQAGQLYYAVSSLWGAGAGGLKLVAQNDKCPLYVAKAPVREPLGQPLALFPEDPKEGIIRERNTLYIKFVLPTNCSESTVWRDDAGNDVVTTGGTSSSSVGPHDSRFALQKHETLDKVYQISPCPCSVGAGWPSCRIACYGALGVGSVNGKSLLRVNANAVHGVIFQKVKRGKESRTRSAAMLNKY